MTLFNITCVTQVSGEAPTDPAKGMEAGAHELHIVKTSYLGLCQAMGSLLCVAKYSGVACINMRAVTYFIFGLTVTILSICPCADFFISTMMPVNFFSYAIVLGEMTITQWHMHM